MAHDGDSTTDLSFGEAHKPAPERTQPDSEAAPEVRAPAPHGATSDQNFGGQNFGDHSDAIARAYKKAKRGGRAFQEITPRPVTAAEAVTSMVARSV